MVTVEHPNLETLRFKDSTSGFRLRCQVDAAGEIWLSYKDVRVGFGLKPVPLGRLNELSHYNVKCDSIDFVSWPGYIELTKRYRTNKAREFTEWIMDNCWQSICELSERRKEKDGRC